MAYDIGIIGAGPAGLTAGIYAGRAKMKTIIISDTIPGGQAMLTDEIENYPGFTSAIKGMDLLNSMHGQMKAYDVEQKQSKVISIGKDGDVFIIKTGKEDIKCLSVIVASGASYRKLGVKGEDKFTGKGVSYCGVCDAPFFRDKDVAVVGGGDTALYEAAHLLKFCSKLHLIHRRDRLRGTKVLQERVLNNKNVSVHWNSVLEEICGDRMVSGIKIKDVLTGAVKDLSLKGVFIFVGITPHSEMVKDAVKMSEKGYILADNSMATSLKGVFTCGDVRDKILRQVSTAVGEGATAAFSAQKHVEELKGIAYK